MATFLHTETLHVTAGFSSLGKETIHKATTKVHHDRISLAVSVLADTIVIALRGRDGYV